MFSKVLLKSAPIKKIKLIQGLISEPNFLLAGISHHHAVSFKSQGALSMFICTYSFYPMLYAEAFRAAHPSAIYVNTCRKEALTPSLPLS